MINGKFDENGRFIPYEEENSADIENNDEVFDNQEPMIAFGELNQGGVIDFKNSWVLTSDNHGGIFILGNPNEFLHKSIIVKDNEDNIILTADIMEIPDNKFKNVENRAIKYMANKVLSINNLNNYDDCYTISLEGTNVEFSLKVLCVTGYEDVENQIDDVYESNNSAEINNNESSTSEISEYMDRIKQAMAIQNNVDDKSLNDIPNETMENDYDSVISDNNSDDITTISIVDQETDNIEIQKFEIQKSEMIYNEENEDESKNITSKIKFILDSFFEAPSLNISINNFVKEEIKLEGDIIIEKIGQYYTATMVNMGFKSFKLIDDNKNNYFTWNDGLESFIENVKERVMVMYSLNEEDINNIKFLIISDENLEEDKENLRFMKREEAIKLLNKKGINTLRIANKNIQLYYIDENLRSIELSANLSGILGLKDFIDDFMKKLENDFTVFNESDSKDKFVVITDMLINK